MSHIVTDGVTTRAEHGEFAERFQLLPRARQPHGALIRNSGSSLLAA